MAGGVQDLNFQDNSEGSCMFFEIVLHEWLHAIGLFHEQSRYDRNNYITLQLKNINQGTISTLLPPGLFRNLQ